MRKLTILAALLIAALFVFGFDITDNTLVSLEEDMQTILAEGTAMTSSVLLKGYERAHILAPYTFSATEASTIELTLYQATGTSATFSESASVTADASVTKTGVLELEAVKDMDYPFVKAEITNNASPATVISGVTVVFYGATHAPF